MKNDYLTLGRASSLNIKYFFLNFLLVTFDANMKGTVSLDFLISFLFKGYSHLKNYSLGTQKKSDMAEPYPTLQKSKNLIKKSKDTVPLKIKQGIPTKNFKSLA